MAEQGDWSRRATSTAPTGPTARSGAWSAGPWRLKSYTARRRRHVRAQRALLRAEQAVPGRVPPGADGIRRGRVQAAAGRPARARTAIQVGYLPLSFTRPPTTPRSAGRTRSTRTTAYVPQVAYCIRYFSLNFNNPTVVGKHLRPDLLPPGPAVHSRPGSARYGDIYQGYAYRQNGPVPMVPGHRAWSRRAQRDGRVAVAVRRGPGQGAAGGQRLGHQHDPGGLRPARDGPGQAGAGIPAGTELTFLLRYVEGRPALTRLMRQFAHRRRRGGHRVAAAGGLRLGPGRRGRALRARARQSRACGSCAAGTAAGSTTTRPARSCSRPTRAGTSATTPTPARRRADRTDGDQRRPRRAVRVPGLHRRAGPGDLHARTSRSACSRWPTICAASSRSTRSG